MELTETTRKIGKCIVVKVMKQMELTETTRKLGKYTQVWSWSSCSSLKPMESKVCALKLRLCEADRVH
jgi:hypothetical protein